MSAAVDRTSPTSLCRAAEPVSAKENDRFPDRPPPNAAVSAAIGIDVLQYRGWSTPSSRSIKRGTALLAAPSHRPIGKAAARESFGRLSISMKVRCICS
jgi:hypothetical protein